MSVIEAETFTNIYEQVSGSILAILEGKNTMAAMYRPDRFAILAAWNRKQIVATRGPHAAPGGWALRVGGRG
jgi:hypothetical protein